MLSAQAHEVLFTEQGLAVLLLSGHSRQLPSSLFSPS